MPLLLKKHNFFNNFVLHSPYVGLILLKTKRSETYSLWIVFIKLLNEIEFWEIQMIHVVFVQFFHLI